MWCVHCQGKLKRGTAPFHVDRNGYHLLFDEVVACICEQCGEPYFEPAEVESIQGAIHALDEHASKLAQSA